MICWLLVHGEAKLTPDIILKLVIVTVKVIFGDIGQYGNIRSESFDIIQLETADLHHIQWSRINGYLPGE